MAVQAIDAETVKYPNSGAIILYDSVLVSSVAAATGTLTPDTYNVFSASNESVELEYYTATESTIDTIAIGGITITGVDSIPALISVYGAAEELMFSDNIIFDAPSMIIRIPEPVDMFTVEISFTVPVGAILQFAVIKAGIPLRMPQPIYGGHSPLALSAKTQYASRKSVTGNFIGRTIEQQGAATNFSWRFLSATWYREIFQPFVIHAQKEPFFIQWRPDYHETEVSYCWTTSDIKPVNMGMGTTLLSVDMEVEAYGGV